MKLIVATRNPGKMREFRLLLVPLSAHLWFPAELGLEIHVAEDGATYAENARRKAVAYVQAFGLLSLADDSGLEVDALDGAPGIRSARYTPGRDENRVAALLKHLHDVPWEERTARFRCVIVVATPSDELYLTTGVCEGYIAFEPAGRTGFGYDPIFYVPSYDCTMAQLSQQDKNCISHRGRAVEAAIPILQRLLSAEGTARRGRKKTL
ncbi:MAG TPA: RdgB/HAM1 family non-canonical purine NTP pyrophosphatase [Chloroflexi bacterium]|nr:RdgB/HAM1 family non-canonical purine NTP pyrophosphatase [Chloroflexota bacterium]